MLAGNVILPAAGVPYLTLVVVAPLILVVEGLILQRFNRAASARAVIECVIGANAVSFVAGCFLVDHLWVGWGYETDERGLLVQTLDWHAEALLGFVQAGVLSFLIEVSALLPFARAAGLQRVVGPMFLANLSSYLILLGIFWLSCGMMP